MIKKLQTFLLPKNFYRYFLKHKVLFIPLVFLVIIIVTFLLLRKTPAVLTDTVVKKDIVKTVSVTGDVDADTKVNLSFQSGEALSWIGVKEGDYVNQWQAIASLDLNKLQASFRQAQQDFIAAKAASEQYYDGHKNATESFEEKVERTALDATQNKAYDQMVKYEYDMAHSTLYSPISGIVTRADAQTAGVNVTAATIFTITDPSSLNFKMEVDEADIGNIQEGQEVKVLFDSFPDKEVNLEIKSIDFVSHKTSSGGNAFYVKADLPDFSNYRVGMSGNADITVDSKKDILVIPLSSLTDNNYVYILSDNKFKKTKVRLGLQSDIEAEVISGLNEGEKIAIDPNSIPQNKIINN